MNDACEAPVVIESYDPSWPERFAAEHAILKDVLAPWCAGPIEHIGSTAVPGLSAKPVIDIMAGVETLGGSRPAMEALTAVGYMYFPYRPDLEHWFCKPSPSFRTHHLHLIPVDSPHWAEHLVFRDHLRRHPSVAAEYAALKQRLAEQYRFDREAYTDAKGPFIASVLKAAAPLWR